MKRKIALVLVCAMAAATIFTACGTEEPEEEVVVPEEEESDEEISAETLLSYTDYDVTEYVVLPDDYMNLTIELSTNYDVTDEDVKEYLESYVLPSYPIYTVTDKTTVEEGDMVNIDYVGTQDGVAFDGGSAEGYDLTIGSGTFIDGFEDGLIGVEVGETVDLNLTFPEDYAAEDLAGQAVVFTVTVNSIDEQQSVGYDDMTDEYVEENFGSSGFTTVDDLVENARESLESSNESSRNSEIQSLVFEKLIEESEITFPDGLLDEKVDDTIEDLKESSESYGIDYEEYITTYFGYDNEDDFMDYVYEVMEDNLNEELILEAAVADQQISINISDFEAFVDDYVSYYGYSSTDVFYDDYGGEDYVKLSYAENLALNAIMDAATVIEPEREETTDDADAVDETDEAADDAEAAGTETAADSAAEDETGVDAEDETEAEDEAAEDANAEDAEEAEDTGDTGAAADMESALEDLTSGN